MNEFLSPSRTTHFMNRDLDSEKIQTPNKDLGYYNNSYLNKVKNSVTRKLISGSAKKQQRMLYADPNDHSFNDTSRFTGRMASPFVINNTTNTQFMPPIKRHLPK